MRRAPAGTVPGHAPGRARVLEPGRGAGELRVQAGQLLRRAPNGASPTGMRPSPRRRVVSRSSSAARATRRPTTSAVTRATVPDAESTTVSASNACVSRIISRLATHTPTTTGSSAAAAAAVHWAAKDRRRTRVTTPHAASDPIRAVPPPSSTSSTTSLPGIAETIAARRVTTDPPTTITINVRCSGRAARVVPCMFLLGLTDLLTGRSGIRHPTRWSGVGAWTGRSRSSPAPDGCGRSRSRCLRRCIPTPARGAPPGGTRGAGARP